jgi:HK97 gp10 family phage protein
MSFEGGRELEQALAELGDATAQRRLSMRALKKAAQPIADAAVSRVPRRRGHLASGITVGTNISGPDAARQAFGQVMRAGGGRDAAVAALRDVRRQSASLVQLFVGPGRHPQAIFQEFGTLHHSPQPFMRPAWDSEGMRAIDRISAELWADIQKTATRQARRAARLAARG